MKTIAAAALALLACTTQAQTLQARDLTGDGVTDAFYDSTHNLTWLADANLYATLGGPADRDPRSLTGATLAAGELRLTTAISWVDSLTVGSVSDWRLPERIITASDITPWCPAACVAATPQPGRAPSELSFLAGVTGQFSNVMNGNYLTWTSDMAWQELRNLVTGANGVTDETGLMTGYVLAVRDGDVGSAVTPAAVTPVPEPQTYALMLAALGGLAIARRRTKRG